MRFYSLFLLLLILVGCTTSDSGSNEPPVTITHPPEGAVIYAESLLVRGATVDSDPQTFTVRVTDSAGDTLVDTQVDASGGVWQVELPHGYSDDPAAFNVQVVIVEDDDQLVPDSVGITLAAIEFRPEGVFGNIVIPAEDAPVGGDSISIEGTVSGTFENTFVVELVDAAENAISSTVVTVTNPYFVDEIPWSTTLATTGYTGEATLNMTIRNMENGNLIVLDSVSLVIGEAAG